jgi:multicomponent Na+:H+ antiporter subunit B
VLLALLLATAIALVKLRGLFAAVMLTGIYSLLTAALFVLLDAVDVAFTEAAVGAGITTVLMLGTLSLLGVTTTDHDPINLQPMPLIVVIVTGAALIYATQDMPAFGDPGAPAHTHVAQRYLTESTGEVGLPNVVTSVLASYRGYDTLGEVAVIFTAGVGVMLLLGRRRRTTATHVEPEGDQDAE